jgi:hypothetical protein
MQVIFGRDFKLEAADPHLFYAFEFWRCSLEARVIVAIGYGFGDEHINKMLSQAIRADTQKRLVIVGNVPDEKKANTRTEEIAAKLGVPSTTLAVLQGTAKAFLKQSNPADVVKAYLPDDAETDF